MALQESFDRLMGGCAARGWMIDDLLALPGSEIVDFARSLGVPTTDLRSICELLMQELDLLELELREPVAGLVRHSAESSTQLESTHD